MSLKHRNLRSPKVVERERKNVITLIFLACLCFFTILAAVILCLRSNTFQIQTVAVEGSTLLPKEALSSAALSALSGSYFHVIPLTSIVFFPKEKITQVLNDSFKEIQHFTIHRSGLSAITISLEERKPAAIVCAGFRDETSSGNCYFSDSKGYVFAASNASSTETSLHHYYIPTDKTELQLGTNFVTENRFKELEDFLSGASRGGLTPLGVLVGDEGEYEMYIKNATSTSEVTVYFDDRSSFEATLSNLLTFWQNTAPSKSFDYINLRFGNTVYYSTQ